MLSEDALRKGASLSCVMKNQGYQEPKNLGEIPALPWALLFSPWSCCLETMMQAFSTTLRPEHFKVFRFKCSKLPHEARNYVKSVRQSTWWLIIQFTQ